MQENSFPKFQQAKKEGRLIGTSEFDRFFEISESSARQLVMAKIFVPDLPGSGPGTANRFAVSSLPKMGFQNYLAKIGFSRKASAVIAEEISPDTWQDVASGEVCYIGLWLDDGGSLLQWAAWMDLELDGFEPDSQGLILVNMAMIMQSIEDKL